MSPKQYKILSKVKKSGVYEYGNASEDVKEAVDFLGKHGYIKYMPAGDDEPVFTPPHSCRITQEGQAAQYEWKVDKIYRLIPTYLAIFAAVGGYRGELALIIQVLKKLLKL